jgi:hypothetical protein
MNAAKKAIRILIIFLTSTWGVFFGILAPIFIKDGDFMPESVIYIANVWFVMAAAGYFAPCFLVMFNLAKSAAVSSVIGTVLALYIHAVMRPVYNNHEEINDVSFMYLPQIFMTVMTILYVFIVNDFKSKREEKHNAPAPSILSRDGNQPPDKQTKRKDK